MSIGTAIFLSALMLAMVGLYAATKGRWNWQRLMKWLIGVPAAMIVIGGLGVWGYITYENRPTPQNEFGSVKVGESMSDVRFKKGEPSKKHSDDLWQYNDGSTDQPEEAVYVVHFMDGKVRSVRYFARGSKIYNPYLQGFTIGSSYDEVIEKLGPPSNISTSKKGLSRILSFQKYRTAYGFEQAKIEALGVYDPKHGPLRFSEEADDPVAPASAASK